VALDKLTLLVRKGRGILREEGVVVFIKRALLFVISPLFRRETYYVYEKDLNELDEAEFRPKTQNCTLKITSTPEQIDELMAEGFDFSFHPNIYDIKKRISRGAIAFCAFVGQDLAHITWVALNKEAKRDLDVLPYAVDFSNNEVCSGASETNPEYRRMGIYAYVYSKIFSFLSGEGLSIDRFTIGKDNIASQNALAKFNPIIYAEGEYSKFLWWKFWKEKPIQEIQQ
jgi:hypothetical protein